MKIRVPVVVATHETKHGVDSYVRVVKKNETIHNVIEAMQEMCDYDEDEPNYGEYFDCDIDQLILDTDDFEVMS